VNHRRSLPSVVFWLGVVSLCTDVATEMVYPLLPLFLSSVLFAKPGFIGVVEGAAESTASILKLISGQIADRMRRRKPLTVFGYVLSSSLRPFIGMCTAPWMVLALRVGDRVGKGLRTSPRDALLADATRPEERGRAYGFHQAMDNAGAVIGPLVATALLAHSKISLRHLFFVTAVPGALAMWVLISRVQEPTSSIEPDERRAGPDLEHAPPLGRRLYAYLAIVALFSLGNSSDAFLLLRAQSLGVAPIHLPLLWMVHNLLRALFSTTGGHLSDRLGRRHLIVAGWIIYGASYAGFGRATAAWQMWALFVLYGFYYALVEGSERALVVELVGARARGRAFGLFHAVVGLVALPASAGFGFIAERFGAPKAFYTAAILAGVAALLLTICVKESRTGGGSRGG
jgi:MFS family permease